MAQLIGPAYRAAFDGQLCLRKNPVSDSRVAGAGLRHIQPADVDFAIERTPDVKHRLVDEKLLKTLGPKG